MKRLIVYDLDGTLVDTAQDIAEAANHMLAVLDASPLPREEIREFVGRGLHDLIRRCLKTDDSRRIRRGLKLFETYYAEHLADHSTLYPRAKEVLDYFKDRYQAVITNKPDPFARDLLTALDVADYFVEILAGGSSYPKKPHPAALVALMKRAQVTPQDTLLMGDSLIDVEMGRHAGVLTVVVTHGFEDQETLAAAAPDVTVRNFDELLALARRHDW